MARGSNPHCLPTVMGTLPFPDLHQGIPKGREEAARLRQGYGGEEGQAPGAAAQLEISWILPPPSTPGKQLFPSWSLKQHSSKKGAA